MRATVLFEDGEVVGGESGAGSLTALGYPLILDGAGDGQPAWIPLTAIRYVVLPGPEAPGREDPREARGCQKVILRFADGVIVRTYRDETFGIVGEGIRVLRWDATGQRFERLLVPSQNLKGIFNVSSWDAAPQGPPEPAGATEPAHPGRSSGGDLEASLAGALVPRLRLALAEIPEVRLARHEEPALRAAIERNIDGLLGATGVQVTPALRTATLTRLIDDAVGYGPLDALLADPNVTEIMVNAPGEIFVQRNGMVAPVPAAFKDEDELVQIVQRMIARAGRRIDHASPIADVRLADGSRVNAVMPPASPRGTMLTIRRLSQLVDSLDGMVGSGVVSPLLARVLDLAVRSRCNILVSGDTGSGKTTLLNVLASRIPAAERIITIEDSQELMLVRQNLVALECRDTNVEGKGRLTIRDLLRNALRMSPDRFIIGDLRGVEAFDMLQAMNTGHNGAMSTIHATSPRDAILSLESLALGGSPGLSVETIRGQIASAIDLVVHVARLGDGRRRVEVLAEVSGIGAEGPQLRRLFASEEGKEVVQVLPVEARSKLLAKILEHGFVIPQQLIGAVQADGEPTSA